MDNIGMIQKIFAAFFKLFVKILLIFSGAVCLILIVDIIERLPGVFAITKQYSKDPVLEWRIKPNAWGHDANGFRNRSVPTHVDVVAIGNSLTWGINVKRREAWPQALEKISGYTVYNMALGGYGPVEYNILLDRALQYSPNDVVIGFYFGNDIYKSFEKRNTFKQAPKNSKEEKTEVVKQLEKMEDERNRFVAEYRGPTSARECVDFLKRQLSLYRFVLKSGLWPITTVILKYEKLRAWAVRHPNDGLVYEKDGVRTILDFTYRLVELDLSNHEISDGLELSKEIFVDMKRKTDQKHVQLIVLFLPTKEFVYQQAARDQFGKLSYSYERLLQMESEIREELTTFLKAHNIQVVDSYPILSEAVRRHEVVYPASNDSHPLVHGYFLISLEVSNTLKKMLQA